MRIVYVLLLGACTPPDPPLTDDQYDDISRAVAISTVTPASGGDLGAIADSMLLAGGNLPHGFTVDAAGVVRGTRAGLAYHYMLVCRDADGAIQHCNPQAELADVRLAWTGRVIGPDISAAVDHEAAWSLAGMHASEVKLAGTSHFSYDATITRAAKTTYHLEYDAAYVGLRVDHQAMLPIAGEIRYAITARESADPAPITFGVDALVTFDGDTNATISLDDRHMYLLDLESGHVDKLL